MSSYEPTVWQAGDKVTSAKLNKIEEGIQAASEGGGFDASLIAPEYDPDEMYGGYRLCDLVSHDGKIYTYAEEPDPEIEDFSWENVSDCFVEVPLAKLIKETTFPISKLRDAGGTDGTRSRAFVGPTRFLMKQLIVLT